MAASEGADEFTRVIAPLHRDRRHLQACDPSLRALRQHRQIVRGQFQAHHLLEKGGGFCVGEAQVGLAEFRQFPPGP